MRVHRTRAESPAGLSACALGAQMAARGLIPAARPATAGAGAHFRVVAGPPELTHPTMLSG